MNLMLFLPLVFCATEGAILQKKVGEEDRTEARHLYARAMAYLSQKKYDVAIPLLKDAKKKDPYFVEAYIALGNAYIGIKDTANARKSFLQVTKIAPKDKRGYQGLGFLYGFYLRKYEKGIFWYKKAYQLDKKDVDNLLVMARLYEKFNKDSADFYYRKLLTLNPEHPEGLKRYLTFLVDNKRYNEAVPYAERAIKKLSNDELVMESAFKVYIQMGEAKKAIEIANDLIKNDPNNYIYYLMRGEAYASLNRYKEALADYNRAENLNPNSIGVHVRKAILYNDLKNYSKALKEGKKAIELGPKTEELQSIVYYVIAESYKGLALSYENKKNWDSALKAWENARTWYSRIYSLGDTPYRDYALKMITYSKKKWEKVKRIKLGISEG